MSLFYVFNPFYVMVFQWFPAYGYLFILSPLLITLLLGFIKKKCIDSFDYLKFYLVFLFLSNTALNIGLTGLVFFIVLIFVITHHSLIRSQGKIRSLIFVLSLFFFANAFWILPFSSILSSLFGNAKVYVGSFSHNFFSMPIFRAFTLFDFFWFGKTTAYDTPVFRFDSYYQNPSELIMICFVIIAIIGFCLYIGKIQFHKNALLKKSYLFFWILMLSGIFLTKGSSSPLGFFYSLALQKIKFFGIYRASDIKFPFLVVFSLPLIISFAFAKMQASLSRILLVLCFISILFLGAPFIRGEVFNNMVTVPKQWTQLSEYFNSKEQPIGRILILPKNRTPFDVTSWGYKGPWLTTQIFEYPSINFTDGYGSSLQENKFRIINEAYLNMERNTFQGSINKFNIHYILVRNDLDYRYVLSPLLQAENINNYAYRLFGNKYYTLYKIHDWLLSSNISGNLVSFSKIDPTEYIIELNKTTIGNKAHLNFYESFDTNWLLFQGTSDSTCDTIFLYRTSKNGESIKECKNNHNVSFFSKFKYLFQQPLISSHTLYLEYANRWTINPKTTNIHLVYKPQLYYLFGLALTFSVLLLFVIHSVISLLIKIEFKRNEN